ncbi:unnamed protein product, partial [Timema podura]|nr:unnamed protein product [Timema podura]
MTERSGFESQLDILKGERNKTQDLSSSVVKMTVQGLFTFFLSLMFFQQALSVKLTDDESNPLTESFVYKETQLILFAEKVTWSEANAICPSYSSKLAVIDTMDKAVFLAAS